MSRATLQPTAEPLAIRPPSPGDHAPREQPRTRIYPISRWYLLPIAERLASRLAATRVRPVHVTLTGLGYLQPPAAGRSVGRPGRRRPGSGRLIWTGRRHCRRQDRQRWPMARRQRDELNEVRGTPLRLRGRARGTSAPLVSAIAFSVETYS